MSQRRRTRRSLALLTSGVLALPLLSGCAADDEGGPAAAGPDIAATTRDRVADGGTLKWAVDDLPGTFNAFQADADATTTRVAGAVLPHLFTLDDRGRPVANPDYLEKAEIVEREPKQVVLYKLHQQAVWSDGREIGASDFLAQWRALSGKDSAFWTARNAGYDRIEKIEKGKTDLEVKVTFARPYADWQSLFSPLYPRQVTADPAAFNEGARTGLKATAGPFGLGPVDKKNGTITLVRNPRWWGATAKLERLVLTAVPRAERPAALASGKVDLAEIDRAGTARIALAHRDAEQGPAAGPPAHGPAAEFTAAAAIASWARAFGEDEEAAEEERAIRAQRTTAIRAYADQQKALNRFTVRKSLEPAWTQLALNGASGPLADERVRRALARSLNRQDLADLVLRPLGLPAKPLGNHLALAGQNAYVDNSETLGGTDLQAAQALLTDAGWRRGGRLTEPLKGRAEAEAGAPAAGAPQDDGRSPAAGRPRSGDGTGNDGLYIVGDDNANGDDGKAPAGTRELPEGAVPRTPADPADARAHSLIAQIEAAARAGGEDDAKAGEEEAGESDAKASPAPAPAGRKPAVQTSGALLAKDGKALTLRFVLPSGPGSESLRAVGERISKALLEVGVHTEMIKVSDASFFKDHIASGQYDLALYAWPATAWPATDARPIFAKPEPGPEGSLVVEQNYTRVGTDQIDQLFDEALGELDPERGRELMRKADARIWAAAGSVPLFQRPELVAARSGVVNAGAFGLGTPRYQDIGWKKAGAAGAKGEKNR
ncbi:ABC transporter family substrate-binding protein [Streptomyces sp. BI20]|uniref:ABC transporter family substrate-binding protein n=1 Tax=Streptomyces sp. BI20 TaxID=3403460 RepID=UPI003C71D590